MLCEELAFCMVAQESRRRPALQLLIVGNMPHWHVLCRDVVVPRILWDMTVFWSDLRHYYALSGGLRFCVVMYLVVVTSRGLRAAECNSVCPCLVSFRQVLVVSLLARPAITKRALPIDVVLMDTGHQSPATAGCGHVTESLVVCTALCCQDVHAIWGETETPDFTLIKRRTWLKAC